MKVARLLAVVAGFALAAGTARPVVRDIYPDPAQAKADIAKALKEAAATHKRILLDFGGDWCGDCHVLDIYLHNAQNRPILESNFILVQVNVGYYDANLDMAKQYGIPLEKGVPALAVLTEKGKLLYSQKNGQFEKMGRLDPGMVTQFLVQWKPVKPGCSAVMVTC
jgi:thioredoxin 1